MSASEAGIAHEHPPKELLRAAFWKLWPRGREEALPPPPKAEKLLRGALWKLEPRLWRRGSARPSTARVFGVGASDVGAAELAQLSA